MQIYFLQPVLIIFTRGAINFDHDCTYTVHMEGQKNNISHLDLLLLTLKRQFTYQNKQHNRIKSSSG